MVRPVVEGLEEDRKELDISDIDYQDLAASRHVSSREKKE